MSSCELAQLDGAYVLGALSASERQQFERHLDACPECAAAVRDLAGLPGLLARVDPDVLDEEPLDEPVPESLLPALLDVTRRRRRRRRLQLGAAAAVLVALGAVAVPMALDDRSEPPAGTGSAAPTQRQMTQVGDTTLTASISLEEVAWGTRLSLTCRYPTPPGSRLEYDAPTAGRFALVVLTGNGRSEQVATWKAVPGRTVRLDAATASGRDDIDAVEVRTTTGVAVLRLRS